MTPYTRIKQLESWVRSRILGQQRLVERMLIALLADGHLLVEGVPGLAKTTAIKVLASGIEGDFHRIQFTPDLLPADLTGTEVFRPQDGTFEFQRGPIFHNFLLADEINRSPAKVPSALLEAMADSGPAITAGVWSSRRPGTISLETISAASTGASLHAVESCTPNFSRRSVSSDYFCCWMPASPCTLAPAMHSNGLLRHSWLPSSPGWQ